MGVTVCRAFKSILKLRVGKPEPGTGSMSVIKYCPRQARHGLCRWVPGSCVCVSGVGVALSVPRPSARPRPVPPGEGPPCAPAHHSLEPAPRGVAEKQNSTECGPGEHDARGSEPVRGRQVPHGLTHLWNLMSKANKQAKQRQTHMYRKQPAASQRVGVGWRTAWRRVRV